MHLRFGEELELAVDKAWLSYSRECGELAKASFVRRLIWLGLAKLGCLSGQDVDEPTNH